HYDRAHRINRIVGGRAKPETKVHAAVGGIQRNQALAHQAKNMTPAVNGRGNWRGVTSLFLPGLPLHFALARPADHGLILPVLFADSFPNRFSCPGIKSDHAGIGLAANHYEPQPGFEQGRTADTEKSGRHMTIGPRVALPS